MRPCNRYNQCIDTVKSFYDNYAKEFVCPFVVFHDDPLIFERASSVRISRFLHYLSPEVRKLVTLVPINLSRVNRSLECPLDIAFKANKLGKWLCMSDRHIIELEIDIPQQPPISCIEANSSHYLSSQSKYEMRISAFLNYRAINILINMGYTWMWRVGLSSRLHHPLGYDMFNRLAEKGKRYAFSSVVRERNECVGKIWEYAVKVCQQRRALDCKGLIHRWPTGVIALTNFEISHRSVWESSIFLDFMSQLISVQRIYEKLPNDGTAGGDAMSIVWWKDAVVHTLSVLLSLSVQETLKLSDVPYQVVDFSLTKSPLKQLSNLGLAHRTGKYRFNKLDSVDKLFNAQRFGWLGGDVASSFQLPHPTSWKHYFCSHRGSSSAKINRACTKVSSKEENKKDIATEHYIWLFGDTLVGTSTNTRSFPFYIIALS